MGPTIYASFDDSQSAKQAIGALIRGGTPAEDITLACKNNSHQVQATDLNPAQDDYPRSGENTATQFSSAPPNAQRDYNKGIEADDYNTNYKGDVDRDMHRDVNEDQRRLQTKEEGVGPAPNEVYAEHPEMKPRGSEPGDVDPDDQTMGAMPQTFPDLRAMGPGNSMGDPSIGGAGTRFAGIAATANASMNPGGMTDFLWNTLPVDLASYYQQQYEGGRAIVIVRAPNETAEEILLGAGALQIQRQGYLA